jgi:DNA-binding response OmpR family regulator
MVAVKAGAHDYLLKPARSEAIRQTLAAAIEASRRGRAEAQLLETMRTSLKLLDDSHSVGVVEPTTSNEIRQLDVGKLHIDLRAYEVRRDGTPVGLSPTEFKLLVALASRAGEAIDYGELVQESMGYTAEPWEAKELIKRHVYALRHKVEVDPGSPEYILNVRGIGYRMASPN